MSQRALLETTELLVRDVGPAAARIRLTTARGATGWAPATLAAAQDLLVKGMTERLLRWGGARPFPTMDGSRTMIDVPDARLVFGDATLELIGWLTSHPGAGATISVRSPWRPADELCLVRALRVGESVHVSLDPPADVQPPHVWLMAGDRLVGAHDEPVLYTDALEPWLVEALQPALTRVWVNWVRQIRHFSDPEGVIRHGLAQERVLGAFLLWAEAAGRPELARFVLEALHMLAALPDEAWTSRPATGAALARRQLARRAALAVPRAAITLRDWVQRWSRVGWLDDGYDRAQWRLRQFESAIGLAERFAPLLSISEKLA